MTDQSTSAEPVTVSKVGDVAVVRFDDGKANAMSHTAIELLSAAVAKAETDAKAVVILGRPDRFSAGFDLSVMGTGSVAARALVGAGARFFVKVYSCNVPVVAGCTGHALAAGAILLMASDVRIGTEGDYRIGLPEVGLGMVLPKFAVALAQDRLSRRHLTHAAQLAKIYSPTEAVDAGFLDRLVPADRVEAEAIDAATQLADTLDHKAFRATRQNLRRATAERIVVELDEDLSAFFVPH